MPRTLRAGDLGADVRALQDVLNFHVRRLVPLAVDGNFGPKTKARVVEFQRSNRLVQDGVAGPITNNKLFETEKQQLSLSILRASASTGFGVRPPTLIPPLTLPGFPAPGGAPLIPVPQLTLMQLPPSSSAIVPPLGNGQVLVLNLTVPSRNDPVDPAVRSFRQIVQLLETLPPNFPFRTQLIGARAESDQGHRRHLVGLSVGRRSGVRPDQALRPHRVRRRRARQRQLHDQRAARLGPSRLKLGFFAKGEFKGTVDYTSELATSTPLFLMQGAFSLGFDGRF